MRPLLAFGLVLGSCGDPPRTPARTQDACEAEGAPTWESYAEGYFRSWCTACHHSALSGSARLGAPEEVNLDTLEDVRAFAARIEARALGDQATMPPAGPSPAEERARIQAWIDCGMPGTDATDPPAEDPCLRDQAWVGDLDLSTAPADFCDQYDRVEGELLADAAVEVAGCICAVSGGVRIVAPVALDRLQSVGGDLEIAGVDTALALPEIEVVGGALYVHDGELDRLDLWRLDQVGSLRLVDLPNLEELDLNGSIVLVEGEMELIRTGIEALDGYRGMDRIGGDLTIAENLRMTELDGFDVLTEIGGSLRVLDNPSLETILGFQLLDHIGGDYEFHGNTSLPMAEIEALYEGIGQVDGATLVYGNGNAP